jgi:hypothetical protein
MDPPILQVSLKKKKEATSGSKYRNLVGRFLLEKEKQTPLLYVGFVSLKDFF